MRNVFAAVILAFGVSTFGSVCAEERIPLIVASTTQVADFARQIVGDRWKVQSILAPGQDPHLYEIKPGDAELVARADLCMENGWHLEGKDWMKRLADAAGKELVVCTANAEPLKLKGDDGLITDPHAWFSPKNAVAYVKSITAAIAKADPDHRDEYEQRAKLYIDQLRVLHHWSIEQFNAIPAERRVLVTSHDAFNYFCREYGFTAQTPAGWSTGDEIGGGVTEERRSQTIKAIQDSGVKAIFVETSVNDKMIRTIADEARVKIGGRLYSDSMGEPGSAGETYIGMMRENVITIVEALK